jgi:hypothetical protein
MALNLVKDSTDFNRQGAPGRLEILIAYLAHRVIKLKVLERAQYAFFLVEKRPTRVVPGKMRDTAERRLKQRLHKGVREARREKN